MPQPDMKKQYRSQASSGRAVSGSASLGTFGAGAFESSPSPLSYVYEPPDLTGISDPNVAVHFKNLMKKDPTTKTKALEELSSLVSPRSVVIEDGHLSAWIRLYPRLSIDTARRVRLLSHTVLGRIVSRSGKRFGPHLPRVVGAWLAGTFDADRGVARAAQDALKEAFPSPDKIQNVWKALQNPIAEYARDAVIKESPQTLSDERTVTKEDADATYHRVVSTSLLVLTSLTNATASGDSDKVMSAYESLLGDQKLYEFSTSTDPPTRRALFRFLRTVLESSVLDQYLNVSLLGTVLISKALTLDQATTASELVTTLSRLMLQHPSIWTTDYKSKKAPEQRLNTFLKRGSQLSSEYWPLLVEFASRLPEHILMHDGKPRKELLDALHHGVSLKEERTQASLAWPAYFRIVDIISKACSTDDKRSLAEQWVLPVLSQFLEPVDTNSQWLVQGPRPEATVAEAIHCGGVSAALVERWPDLTARLVENMKVSQSQQSQDFAQSQDLVRHAGQRWVLLQASFSTVDHDASPVLLKVLQDQRYVVVDEAINLLKSRNGKPYGAASLICDVSKHLRTDVDGHEKFLHAIEAFLRQDAPPLLESPSQTYLLTTLYDLPSGEVFENLWSVWLHAILSGDDRVDKVKTLRTFLLACKDNRARNLARKDAMLQQNLQATLTARSDMAPGLLQDLMPFASTDSQLNLLTETLERLSLSQTPNSAVEALSDIEGFEPKLLHEYVKTDEGSHLISQLVLLEQSAPEEVADKAGQLRNKLGGTGSSGHALSVEYLQRVLSEASPRSLPIDIVLDTLRGSAEDKAVQYLKAFTDLRPVWQESIAASSSIPPAASLALMSPLGGAAQTTSQTNARATAPQTRDSDGLSAATRIAMVATAVLTASGKQAPEDVDMPELLFLIALTSTMANDNLSVRDSNASWLKRPKNDIEPRVVDFVADSKKFIHTTLAADKVLAIDFLDRVFASIDSNACAAFVSANVYATIALELIEAEGSSDFILSSIQQKLDSSSKQDLILKKIAVAAVLSSRLESSTYGKRLANELVSRLTEADVTLDPTTPVEDLIHLNVLIGAGGSLESLIAKQRVVFFVKHILEWLANPNVVATTKAEILFTLRCFLPMMADIYGEYWSSVLEAIVACWNAGFGAEDFTLDQPRLLYVHNGLRLHKTLSNLVKGEDANEDLADAWKEHETALQKGIIYLLGQDIRIHESDSTPLRITNELIGRQAQGLKEVPRAIASSLYSPLDSSSPSIQEAAFVLLQQHVHASQEQISFDAALGKKTAHLPEELLSLILAPPDIDEVLDADFKDAIPSTLKTYLFSWLLVFAHFHQASYKVKADYAEDIKSGDHLAPLLRLVYEFLGHTTGHAVDASKFDASDFSLHRYEAAERECQHLLTHLYYLSLLYLPSLTKASFLAISNRSTSTSISTWTAKSISPQIISKSLLSVEEWAATFANDPEHENFSVKVSQRAKEITAVFLVDEQQMAIMIRLPDEYPLQGAKVEGVSRVALDAKKWQSWLRNCQGVIQFSNGNLVDGVNSWRRNVLGALKGASECAICYSIISADKQLPSKRCLTCKNLFHSSCLFKWFKSSNASACPLCRNPFNYG